MAYGKIKADAIIYDNGGSDVEKTIASLAGAAPTASPTFTGTPAAPTATAGTNTTQIATTAFVTSAVPTNSAIDARADARVTAAVGSSVQAFDADTTKNDVANTFTAAQTLNAGLTVDGPYKQVAEAVSALEIDLSTVTTLLRLLAVTPLLLSLTHHPQALWVALFLN